MNTKEFIKALNSITEEKGISKDYVLTSLEQALAAAYKKNFNSKTNVEVKIDRETGDIKVFSYYIVVDDFDDGRVEIDEEGNEVHIPPEINVDAQILYDDVKDEYPNIKIGDEIRKEVTPHDFGRVAASTAKQVLTQKMRERERSMIMEEFQDKEGEMMMGMLAMEDAFNYYVDLGNARGILPKSEMIPGEKVSMGSSIKVYITKVSETPKGPSILCSRKHFGFVKRLFETEIPELADGTIELMAVIREPGLRSKVAVMSNDEHVDPIGACIGQNGSRIANILKELNGEKVDLIKYSSDPATYIANALAPAKNITVSITDPEHHVALAIADDDNLSLAIGKKGSNIKLASRLTKYRIEIKTLAQINEEGNMDNGEETAN